MADDLGLSIQITADPAQAQAGLAALQDGTFRATQAIVAHGNATHESMASGRESVRLLTEDMGIHLPRGITSAIAKMQDFQQIIGLAFQVGVVVFFVEHLGKMVGAIQNAADALGGFDKALKTDLAGAVKASDDAFAHFTNTLIGSQRAMEASKAISRLEAEKEELANTGLGNSVAKLAAEYGLMGIAGMAVANAHRNMAEIDKELVAWKEKLAAVSKNLVTVGTQESIQRVKDIEDMWKKIEEADKKAAEETKKDWEWRNTIARENLLRLGDMEEQAVKRHVQLLKDQAKFDTDLEHDVFEERRKDETNLYKAVEAAAKIHFATQKKEFDAAAIVARNHIVLLNSLEQASLTAFTQMTGHVQGWAGVVLRIFEQMAGAYLQQMVLDALSATEHTKNVTMKTSVDLLAMERYAIKKAIMEFGEGEAALATYDFWAAAHHFGAAALFGGLAAAPIVGIVLGAIGSGGGGSARAAAAAVASPSSRSSAAGGSAAGGTTTTVINIEGINPSKFYSGNQIHDLINQINLAVVKGGAILISSSTFGPSAPAS
jgi:hypothetical protein